MAGFAANPLHAFFAGFVVAALLVGAVLLRRARVIRRNALEQSRRVLRGLASEQLAPLVPAFAFSPSDARFLGNPIDYVVFDGYGDGDDVEIVFVEVKSGAARLSEGERRIRTAIERGRVRFELVRIDVE